MKPYREQIADGKDIAIAFVRQKLAELQVSSAAVGWTDRNLHAGTHCLQVEARGRYFTLEYRDEDLADAPATPEIRGKLQRKAESLVREILHTPVSE